MAIRRGGIWLLVLCLSAAQGQAVRSGFADVPAWQRAAQAPPWDGLRKAPLWEPSAQPLDERLAEVRVALASPRLEDVRLALAKLGAVTAPSVAMRMQLGEAYFRVGQFNECKTMLAPIASQADLPPPPGHVESMALLYAHCLSRAGLTEDAIVLLQASIRRGRESATSWFLLGEALALRGAWRKANDAFVRSLQLGRSGSAAWAAAVSAELAFGQIEGERAALIALSVDSRPLAWRRAYLGSTTTNVPTISPVYEFTAQALILRTLERYTDALAMARLAAAAHGVMKATPAVKRDFGDRLALITTYLTPLAARGDLRAAGIAHARAEALLAPHLPSLRACAKATPNVVYEIKLARGMGTVKPVNNDDATGSQISEAVGCQKRLIDKIKLPAAEASPPPTAGGGIAVGASAGNRPPEIVFKVISL